MGNRFTRYGLLILVATALLHPPALLAAPADPPPAARNKVTDTLATSAGELRLTPIYHGSVMIEFAGKVIHVDPWSRADYTGLPPADLIVITHTHADHLDRAMVTRLKKDGMIIVGPDAVIDTLNCAPACGEVETVNNGESKTVLGVRLEGVAMYNLVRGSKPGVPYHHKGVGSGYVMSFGTTRVYFSGDSECTPEMKALKNIDVAFLNMSASRTMSPTEAAECVKTFKPKIVYPLHYAGSKPSDFADHLKDTPGIEVRIRKLEGET